MNFLKFIGATYQESRFIDKLVTAVFVVSIPFYLIIGNFFGAAFIAIILVYHFMFIGLNGFNRDLMNLLEVGRRGLEAMDQEIKRLNKENDELRASGKKKAKKAQ